MSQWTFSICSFFIRHKVVNKTTRYRMEFVNRCLIVNLLQASVDNLSNLCFSQPLSIGTFGMVTDGTKVIFFILKTTWLGRQNETLKSDLTLLNTSYRINLLNVFSHAKIVWAMIFVFCGTRICQASQRCANVRGDYPKLYIFMVQVSPIR